MKRQAETTHIVVSDVHLGDGDPITENWRAAQQAAWEHLLRAAAPGGAHAVESVELIVNGDCFDFLVAAPALDGRRSTNAATSLAKIERIAAAHPRWFAALHDFLAAPSRMVTFLIGNHDVELAFAAVRTCVRRAIDAEDGAVRFCLRRAYRPAPDVEIEHGCQFDPWNRVPGLWDGPDDPVTAGPDDLEVGNGDGLGSVGPDHIELPWGTRYYYRVFAPIVRRFPYIEALLPVPEQPQVLALLCLYAPELVIERSRRAQSLLADLAESDPPLTAAAAVETRDAAPLFLSTLPRVAALQAAAWQSAGAEADAKSIDTTLAQVQSIAAGLAQGEIPALRAIFAAMHAGAMGMPALDASAAHVMLARDARLSLALCGHTHAEGTYHVPSATQDSQVFLNTGTWYARLAAPAPEAIDEAIAAWLRDPRAGPSPLAPATAFTFALVRSCDGQRSTSELLGAESLGT